MLFLLIDFRKKRKLQRRATKTRTINHNRLLCGLPRRMINIVRIGKSWNQQFGIANNNTASSFNQQIISQRNSLKQASCSPQHTPAYCKKRLRSCVSQLEDLYFFVFLTVEKITLTKQRRKQSLKKFIKDLSKRSQKKG